MDAFDKQNAEFDALDKLIKAYRAHNQVAVVEDDYPQVRRTYEAALKGFLDACAANGRRMREK